MNIGYLQHTRRGRLIVETLMFKSQQAEHIDWATLCFLVGFSIMTVPVASLE